MQITDSDQLLALSFSTSAEMGHILGGNYGTHYEE